MKILLCSLLLLTAAACYGDIQDPPANDYGPTRKLARAIANLCPVTAFCEVPNTVAEINEREGNASAFTFGFIQGFGKFFARMGFGWYEFVTFPFPTYKAPIGPSTATMCLGSMAASKSSRLSLVSRPSTIIPRKIPLTINAGPTLEGLSSAGAKAPFLLPEAGFPQFSHAIPASFR